MKLPNIAAMFQRAIDKSRDDGSWVCKKRDFEACFDGVQCLARCRIELIVDFEDGSGHVQGEVIVLILTVEGERVECMPGWVHFAARDTAIADPAPLLELAAAEAAVILRADPVFRACADRLALERSTPASTRAPSRRI